VSSDIWLSLFNLVQDQRWRKRTAQDQRGVEHRRPRASGSERAQVCSVKDASSADDVQRQPREAPDAQHIGVA
jgi:hypothetical protein